MSQVFDVLQDRYRDLLLRSEEGAADQAFLDAVRAFLSDARQAGSVLPEPEERGQLRAYIRYLAELLYEAGHEVPAIDLLPLDRRRLPARTPDLRARAALPWWVWMLVGAASLAVLAALVAVAGFSAGALPSGPTATSPPPTPLPSPLPSTPTASPTPVPPTPTSTLVPTATPLPPAPVLGDLTIALGILGSGEPFLIGNEFDWNTKAVYAVFDYSGMRDGLAWSVVWTRNGEELARENNLWDGGSDGEAGTLWVAYFEPSGVVLRGGDYAVALYLEGELQAESSFRIRYYVPATVTP